MLLCRWHNSRFYGVLDGTQAATALGPAMTYNTGLMALSVQDARKFSAGVKAKLPSPACCHQHATRAHSCGLHASMHTILHVAGSLGVLALQTRSSMHSHCRSGCWHGALLLACKQLQQTAGCWAPPNSSIQLEGTVDAQKEKS